MSKQPAFFYREEIQKKLFKGLLGICFIFLALEFFVDRKSYFAESGIKSIDGVFGFYILLGILGCLFFLVVSKVLGALVKVDESYYDGDL